MTKERLLTVNIILMLICGYFIGYYEYLRTTYVANLAHQEMFGAVMFGFIVFMTNSFLLLTTPNSAFNRPVKNPVEQIEYRGYL